MSAKPYSAVQQTGMSPPGNVTPLASWKENSAQTGSALVKCSQELLRFAKTASDVAIDGALDYGKELRQWNAKLADLMSGSLEQAGHALMGERVESLPAENIDALLAHCQNFVAIGRRQFEGQIQATLGAYQAISGMSANFLGR